ncbi:MAG TPA: hypothetical protein PLJ49_09995 [Smithella sp.]|jgi:hypothetical protein|nr:hypothetical protein [Smithella sp.]
MLTPYLSNPIEVMHKMEREAYRAFHQKHIIHKADHFYNFCITALSMKDSILDYLGKITESEQNSYYFEWSSQPCLIAVTEIANTAKHVSLKKINKKTKTKEIITAKTKGVKPSSTSVVNIYEDDEGTIYKDYDNNYPDYKIILSNGKEFTLSELTTSVIDYWRNYLLCVGIEYKKQEEKIYFGI